MRKALLLAAALLVLLTAAQAATAADFTIKKDGATVYSRTYTGTSAHGCLHLHRGYTAHSVNSDFHSRSNYSFGNVWVDFWSKTSGGQTRDQCWLYPWTSPGPTSDWDFRWFENPALPGQVLYAQNLTGDDCVDVDVLNTLFVFNSSPDLYVEYNYTAGQGWTPTSSVTVSIHTDGACVN